MTEILNPEEVKRRRSKSTIIYDENALIEEEKQQEIIAKNYAGTAQIDYESMGRFDTPSTLHFKDFTNKHVNDLQLTSQDNLIDTLVNILNECKIDENDFKIENMTAEDLLETLIAIKIKYESIYHTHRWICDCQNDKDENDQTINETVIDLSSLEYVSIEQADEEMKKFFLERLEAMTDEEYNTYLYRKYKNDPLEDIDSHTREKEVNTIKIQEPITFSSNDDIYTVRFPRVKDIIEAKNYAERQYASKIKAVQNRKEHGVPLHELKEKKEKEIKSLKEEQAKLLFLYAKAMTLLTKNGVELSNKDKFEEYKDKLSRSTAEKINFFFEKIQFGLQHEITLTCPICGSESKRWLQRVIDPRELLPYGNSDRFTSVSTDGKSGLNTGFDIYFGI